MNSPTFAPTVYKLGRDLSREMRAADSPSLPVEHVWPRIRSWAIWRGIVRDRLGEAITAVGDSSLRSSRRVTGHLGESWTILRGQAGGPSASSGALGSEGDLEEERPMKGQIATLSDGDDHIELQPAEDGSLMIVDSKGLRAILLWRKLLADRDGDVSGRLFSGRGDGGRIDNRSQVCRDPFWRLRAQRRSWNSGFLRLRR